MSITLSLKKTNQELNLEMQIEIAISMNLTVWLKVGVAIGRISMSAQLMRISPNRLRNY
jgi:hypothetical protein